MKEFFKSVVKLLEVVIKGLTMLIVVAFLFDTLFMFTWNFAVVPLFGFPQATYWQGTSMLFTLFVFKNILTFKAKEE